jgi:ApaG protein
MIYHARTKDIVIKVRPEFLDGQSDASENSYVWAYHIRIENAGDMMVQLLVRHWRITDAYGHERRVDDDGVVGLQPLIAPGEFFEYNSGVNLKTPSGFMRGYYEFEDEDGNEFNAEIPAFSLDSHYQSVVLQ